MWKQDKYVVLTLIVFVMTVLGTLANFANDVLSGREFNLRSLFLQVIIAIFCGALVLLTASYYEWAAEFAGGMAGMAGWMGANFIKLVERLLVRRFGSDNHEYK